MTQNSEQVNSKLPLDVLAKIFSIGEELERSDWRAVKYDTPFRQSIMVCTYWRQVAITTSTLWTYLRVTDSPYDQIVPLYLARAGPSALLDIDLGTYATTSSQSGSHRCLDSAEDISYILHALNFLISNGAIPDRWRSLLVCSERSEALPALVGFLNSKSAPNLRFLSFRLRGSARREVDMSIIAEHTSAARILGHWQTSVPNLRHLELALVPSAFIFSHSLSPCAGLTALDIDVADALCSAIEMHKVLSVNRGLKFLALRFGSVFDATNWPTSEVQLIPEQVLLPKLEDFVVIMPDEYVSWARAMVRIVDAPALKSFQISCPRMASYQSKKLVRYITSGTPTRSNTTASTSSSSRSIYPLLRALNISDFPCTPKYLVRLLSAFPLVTEISIAGTQARWLSKLNWLLPRISKLRVTKPSLSGLAPLLTRWAKEGPLVKTLHVQTLQWKLNGQLELPKSIVIIAPIEQYTNTEGRSHRNHTYVGLKEETESYSEESDENEWDSGSEMSEENRVYRHGWCGTDTASNVIIDASDSEWFG